MSPTLPPGRLVVFVVGRPKIDGVVMLQHEGREKIKRLALARAGRIYVTGDNPPMSTDSRDFGWLPAETIIAKLLWPRRK
jgi:phage repressor protein C with HTH and peptisase S24 domain